MSAKPLSTVCVAAILIGLLSGGCGTDSASPASAGDADAATGAGGSVDAGKDVSTTGGSGGVGTGGTAGSGGSLGSGGADGSLGSGGADGSLGSGGADGSLGSGGADGGAVDAGPCDLPTTFKWKSSGVVIPPISDATHVLTAVKDPTVVFFNDRWHVYATTAATAGGWNMLYQSFTDWPQAKAASPYYLDTTPGLAGYHCAPQLFYFTPQNKWYLVYQDPPSYSTADDPSKPDTWTAPKPFYATKPAIITANGGWLDFWVICDAGNCHMFFSDDNGRLYRSQTAIGSFPNGFGDPAIVMQDTNNKYNLYEASNVYKVKGKNEYLLLVEAIGPTGFRFFRSWTATSLTGSWTPLADSWASPFAGLNNVTFDTGSPPWTKDISHGEILRDGYDETLTIDACNLRYLHQGMDPTQASLPYYLLPYQLGLLTQVP